MQHVVGDDDVVGLALGEQVAAACLAEFDAGDGLAAGGEVEGPCIRVNPRHLELNPVPGRPAGEHHGEVAAAAANVQQRCRAHACQLLAAQTTYTSEPIVQPARH